MDESLPYPYVPPKTDSSDSKEKVRMSVTLEEQAFMERVRQMPKKDRQTPISVPGLSMEKLFLLRELVKHEITAGVAGRLERLFRGV